MTRCTNCAARVSKPTAYSLCLCAQRARRALRAGGPARSVDARLPGHLFRADARRRRARGCPTLAQRARALPRAVGRTRAARRAHRARLRPGAARAVPACLQRRARRALLCSRGAGARHSL